MYHMPWCYLWIFHLLHHLYWTLLSCVQYIHNFNPEKSKNPFAYFTQIIHYAFLRRIQREKRQLDIKNKIVEKTGFEALMTADANLTRTQQRIIAKHLRASFGSRVIIPESRQYLLGNTQKHPNASCGCYQFQPDPKKEPESCHFWYLDATEVLLSEVNLYVESLHASTIRQLSVK